MSTGGVKHRIKDGATGVEVSIPVAPKRLSAYQTFFKLRNGEVARANPQLKNKEVMELIATMWKEVSSSEREELEARSERDFGKRTREWNTGKDEREFERMNACKALGMALSTSWEALVDAVAARNPGQAGPGRSPKAGGDKKGSSSSTASTSSSGVAPVKMKKVPAAAAAASSGGGGGPSPKASAQGDSTANVASRSRSWTECWMGAARRKAVIKGLDAIFAMAGEEQNFEHFGNDMIQCFYDVARATGDPVRSRALMYVEQLAQRWRHSIVTRGWRQVAGVRPSPQNILETVIGIYCMERVGVSSARLKQDVLEAVKHPGKAGEDESEGDKPYGPVDYFGWDPRRSPGGVPDDVPEVLSGETASKYRTLCNSLIHSFYAERATVDVGCGYADVLAHLDKLRPYKGPNDLQWDEYIDQCYLVTHVVFTLNNWGELALEPELLPHEHLFIKEHIGIAIRERDVHLGAGNGCENPNFKPLPSRSFSTRFSRLLDE